MAPGGPTEEPPNALREPPRTPVGSGAIEPGRATDCPRRPELRRMAEHTPDQAPYPPVPTRVDLPAVEQRTLERWDAEGTFRASIDARPDADTYTFNDGPPFANGLPHYGHLLTGYVKDVVPRFQTMRGRRVERVFGWDTHGLPAEMETEKELGVSGRAAITDYGIENFNADCRASVMKYTAEWRDYVTRQARWVDFDNGYKTYELDYMESVIWAFKQLWDSGLVYETQRVMPYSWGAETPLANFEIRMDDATRPRQDPAVTVGFSVVTPPEGSGLQAGDRILAWTTTPWTLPSNLALAVGPDVTYAVVDLDGQRYVLGAEVLERYAPQLGDGETVATLSGADLVGATYEPIFDYFADLASERGGTAFRVLGADWVEVAEGTGVVHIAPGFGEDDQTLGAENGIDPVVPVDDSGRFTAPVTDWLGTNVLEANPEIIRRLKESGVLVRHDSYTHNYPHCWRTDTPIIYRAIPSWYVEVTAFRDRMVELNQGINWIPDHVKDGAMGRWLEGARDWSISRNRFWGTPIPVWKSDNPDYPRVDAYGSLDELEADFGVRPTDLHRPFIDELVRPNPDDPTGQSMMRRVPEVFDCWFESGSMPFAQFHYPFEASGPGSLEGYPAHAPADFIVEYIGQTRGWFYTQHVLSTALFDQPAFDNCICHGVVLDAEGKKLSKKLRNYPDPLELFESQGSDAVRWFLMSSPILRGNDLRIDSDGAQVAETRRKVIDPIWNALHFFTLYANAEGHTARFSAESGELLDRYILAKTRQLADGVGEALDAYELAVACERVESFLGALTNWYIRRSRDRFWATGDGAATSADAFDTLYTVLVTLTKTIAPLAPMLAEEMWAVLMAPDGATDEAGFGRPADDGTPSSVHLALWPDASDFPDDPDLVVDMDRVRDATTAALYLREERGLRARLPLASLTLAGAGTDRLGALSHLLADEVNVKSVGFSDDLAAYGSFVLRPNGKVLGPKLGKDVQAVIKAAKAGEWTDQGDGTVEVAGHVLSAAAGEFELGLDPLEGAAVAALPGNDAVVALDVEVTDELAAEGAVRDLIRLVQQARKDEDLVVTDRIALTLDVPDELATAVTTHQAALAEAVLATTVTQGRAEGGHSGRVQVSADGTAAEVTFSIELAQSRGT